MLILSEHLTSFVVTVADFDVVVNDGVPVSLPSPGKRAPASEPAGGRLGEVKARAEAEARATAAASAAVRRRRRRVAVAGLRRGRGRRVGLRRRRGGCWGIVPAVTVIAAVVRLVVVTAVVGLMVRLGMVVGVVVWFVLYGGVSLAAAAVDGLRVVARAQVLVEDGAVAALERLLATVRLAEVVDLQRSRHY